MINESKMPEKIVLRGQHKFIVGIDPGTHTGIAIWRPQNKSFMQIETVYIHKAIQRFFEWKELGILGEVFVRVEDARQAVHGRNTINDRHKLQGAGSIKRDATIWEDFLTDLGVDFEMVRPKKSITKMNAELFKKITGFQGRVSEHGRDASLLVYGF